MRIEGDLDTYLSQSSKALEIIGERGIQTTCSCGQHSGRADGDHASLGVVVANTSNLEGYARIMVAGNIDIYVDGFIPRFIADKPSSLMRGPIVRSISIRGQLFLITRWAICCVFRAGRRADRDGDWALSCAFSMPLG